MEEGPTCTRDGSHRSDAQGSLQVHGDFYDDLQVLVFVNANRKFYKRTDTIIAFTREYSRVSYLSTGKQ
jgi:hypothetical protein